MNFEAKYCFKTTFFYYLLIIIAFFGMSKMFLLCMVLITSVEQIRWVFVITQGWILSVLHKNICCGYSLKSPRRGDSYEYQQLKFLWWNKKILPKLSPYTLICSTESHSLILSQEPDLRKVKVVSSESQWAWTNQQPPTLLVAGKPKLTTSRERPSPLP